MKRLIIALTALFVLMPAASAQNERRSVRNGNHDFRKAKYQQAEIDYKKALIADSLSNAASYNLGNTYYRMEDFAQASKCYETVADSLSKEKNKGASLYHNMGNAFLKQRNWQGAIDAYKNALRRNPSDMDTKANLAYAKKMLENEQQNQDQNQQQNQDQNQQNQDQNQQNQNQNKDQNQDQQQNKQEQDQNKDQNKDQNQNQNQDQQQQPQPQDQKISQKDAQQMLQAIQDKEDQTQEKVKKEKALMMQSKQKEKNW